MNASDTTIPDSAREQIAKMGEQYKAELTELVRLIIQQQNESAARDEADSEERRTLDRIKQKDFVSPGEGAMLLGCSAAHLRNLVNKAIKGQASVPIPYADLDGVLTFPTAELLQWARLPKSKAKKASTDKSHLKALVGGKQL